MFFGQPASYIDPSISGAYRIPSPVVPREKDIKKEGEMTTAGSVPTQQQPAASQAPQKIPESELEGVPLPTPRDDVHDKAP
jgi:hypothetical protein